MVRKKGLTGFQFLTIGVFLAFIGMMTVVTITAYWRPSHGTGLSMVDIQQMRIKTQVPLFTRAISSSF